MILIYGLNSGETERYQEQLLSSCCKTQEQVDAVKVAASKDGFHSFRVVNHDENMRPDFTNIF